MTCVLGSEVRDLVSGNVITNGAVLRVGTVVLVEMPDEMIEAVVAIRHRASYTAVELEGKRAFTIAPANDGRECYVCTEVKPQSFRNPAETSRGYITVQQFVDPGAHI